MSRIREFNLPDLGEGLADGEILKWLVQVGDVIELNQPIVEVETAKAAVEIPAKWGGRVQAIFHGEGETVEVGTPIIAIDTQPHAPAEPITAPAVTGSGAPPTATAPAATGGSGTNGAVLSGSAGAAGTVPSGSAGAAGTVPAGASGGEPTPTVLVGYGPRRGAVARRPRLVAAAPAVPAAPPAPLAPPGARAVTTAPQAVTTAPAPPAPQVAPAPPVAPVASPPRQPVLAKPPVRRLARDLGVDLTRLTGTGPQGSITRMDVQAAVDAAASRPEIPAPDGTGRVGDGAVAAEGTGTGAPAALLDRAGPPATGPEREHRIAVRGIRRLTAEHMVASAFTAPHVTEFLTVDVTRAMRALRRLGGQPEWRDVRASPLLLVAKAVLLAVRRHPMVNSAWSEATGEIVQKDYVNLGIAAATDRGLIVPNIKDAGRLSLLELAEAMNTLVRTARSGRTAPADMAGGTFTITNVGVFGVDTGTPILPPGEAAILAFGAVREMPWVHKKKIRVRQVTTLGLSFDHRIIDGELGSLFLRDVGRFLADPGATLLAWG